MEWGLQFCLLFLLDTLGASLDLCPAEVCPQGPCHISNPIPAASQDEYPWPCAASPAYRIPISDTLTGIPSSSVLDASGQFLLFLLCLENQMAPRLVFSCGRADT